MNFVSLRDAEQWYDSLAAGEDFPIASIVQKDEHGQDVDEEHLRAVASDLVSMARNVEKGRNDAFMRFEADASVLLHQELDLDPETVARREFWVWASIAVFRDLIQLRHPGTGLGLSHRENYGFRSRWNGLIYRLWSRGEQGFDPSFDKDPYYHAKLGHIDMWRSHVLRVDHGGCRNVSHAFLREAYDPTRSCSGAPIPTLIVRTVAKNLRKLHATLPLELLSQQDAEDLVREEIRRATLS